MFGASWLRGLSGGKVEHEDRRRRLALTPRGLEIDGHERKTLERMVQDFRSPGLGDREVVERMLAGLQGYTWAVEVDEGDSGLASAPGPRQEGTRGADGGCGFCPIETDDSWLDAAAG